MNEWGFPNKATPAGSESYYCIRLGPEATRDALAVLFAWRRELQRMVERATDPGATRLKLDWWRKELNTIGNSTPAHPLAKALQPLITSGLDKQPFMQMLRAAEDDVVKRQIETPGELYSHCDRWGESFIELVTLASGGNQADIRNLKGLGRYIALVYRIRDLHAFTDRAHNPLPRALLDAKGIRDISHPAEVDQGKLGDLIQKLLVESQENASRIISDRKIRNDTTLPAIRLAAQVWLLDKAMQRSGYQVTTRFLDISPLRKLWAAWRIR